MTEIKIKRLNLVQLFRAIAILFVVFGHGSTLFYNRFSYDWFGFGEIGRTGGVDFFFVVSGFIIYFLYHKNIGNKEKAWSFLGKRAMRIYPLYWVFIVASLTIFIFFPELADGQEKNIVFVLKSLILLPTDSSILAVTWSLSHVMLFYVLFSLFIYKGWMFGWLLTAWAFAITVSQFLLDNTVFILSFNNVEILSGMLAAWLILNVKIKKPKLLIMFGMLGYMAVWANFTTIGKENLLYFYSLFAFLIMVGIAAIDMKKEVKIPKTISFVGDASYSVFLAHGQFLHFFILLVQLTNLNMYIGNFFTFFLVLSFTAISCGFVYIFVEKPLLSFIKRMQDKRVIEAKSVQIKWINHRVGK